MPTLAPTGRQLALQVGPARAVVVERRGAVRSLSVGGSDLVQGYGEAEPVTDGRGQHCAPWPNRVRDGSWNWRGKQLQLPDECPFGYAAHPYLVCASARVDELTLDLPAGCEALVDPVRLLPTGSARCDPGPRPLAGVQLDTCFGDLRSDSAALLGPDGRGVELVADRTVFPWWQVYTGDDLPVLEQRRTAVALEPMTCPPDALRTGEDLVVLAPGDCWEGQWELRAVP